MKITYMHQYFNTPDMKGPTRSYELARRLVQKGHQVNMVTTYRDRTGHRSWFVTEEDGIKVHWLPVPYDNTMSYARRTAAFFSFAIRSARYAASLEADVLFATSTPLTIVLPAAYASRANGIPLVFEVRDLWPELPIAIGALSNPILIALARQLEKFAYGAAKSIVALSPGMRDGILKQGYPAHKITVITNGSDLKPLNNTQALAEQFLTQHSYLRGKPLVLYGGTLGVINGVSYLVDLAFEAVKLSIPMNFLVIGTGMEERKVRARAQELGVLGRNFFMLDPLQKNEMPMALAAADIAISLFVDIEEMWANSANKFFDALAAGKPVAINYGGWQADLLSESNAGVQLPPIADERAVRLLASRLQDSSWLSNAQRNARKLAENKFDHNILALSLEQVLLEAVV